MNPQSWVGKKIGDRYQIDMLLGQGGMSAVYRAYDPNLRRKVAIKLIHSHISTDPKFIDRFKEEAAAVARLRHPNIVQVHDFNFDGENYYMVLEYLEGDTLYFRLKRLNAENRFLDLHEAVQFCIQLCNAVGYAHTHDLIHRDIKPANVMINLNGQAILMDFGIVKIVGGDYHTATGVAIGTATYMSPEQIRSEHVDKRSDIYSLGVTLFEMLSGKPPYQADSALSLMMTVLRNPLPDLRGYRKNIPADLQRVVEKSLAKDVSKRFQTMEEMATALQQAQKSLDAAPSIAINVESFQTDQSKFSEPTPQNPTEVDAFSDNEPEPSLLDPAILAAPSEGRMKNHSADIRSKIMLPGLQPIAKLVWIEESVEKEIIITSKGLTLGRSSLNDLPLNDLASSRFHCKILPEGGELTLVDLGSTNGTLLNGARISGNRAIMNRDEIRIGNLTFQVENLHAYESNTVSNGGNTEPISLAETSGGKINKSDLAWLVVCSGVGTGTTFLLSEDRLLVGRASHTKQWDIDLVDPFVSRPHAELSLQEKRWVLRDLESDNGTTVNGKPVTNQLILYDGDRIGLGETMMIFRWKNAV